MDPNPLFVNGNLLLSGLLFLIGLLGFFAKKNAISLFMCIELMLNAANLAFVTFAYMFSDEVGQVVVLFVMTLAAAEAGVGLAIFISLTRHGQAIDVDKIATMKG